MNKKIFHIVSSKRYTGGAQVAYLWHKALLDGGIESFFVYKGGYKLQEKLKNEKNTIPYFNLIDKTMKILKFSKNSLVLAHLSEDHWLSSIFGGKKEKVLVFHTKFRKDLLHRLTYRKNIKAIFAYKPKEKPIFKNFKIFPPVYDLNLYFRGNQPSNMLNICTIGKIEKERGHHKFIFLCNELKKLNFKFNGYVIGKGSHLQKLKDLRDEFNLKKEIEFLGYFEDEELAKILRKMDILVWTSPGSQLSHRAIVEAILCGALPSSYEMEGIDFWIQDGKSGIILSDDLKESAEKIIEIFENKEKYTKIRDNSFKETIEKVDPKKFVESFIKFLYENNPSSA